MIGNKLLDVLLVCCKFWFFWWNVNCNSLSRWFPLVYVGVLFIRTAKVKQNSSLARLRQESVSTFKDEKYFLLLYQKNFFPSKPKSRKAHHPVTYSFLFTTKWLTSFYVIIFIFIKKNQTAHKHAYIYRYSSV